MVVIDRPERLGTGHTYSLTRSGNRTRERVG